MRAEIKKGRARGTLRVPPSKSCAHRWLLGAALAEGESVLHGLDFSEDILATIDCVKAIGAKVIIENNAIKVKGCGARFSERNGALSEFFCRESGSTLRFMIPIALLGCGGVFLGTERLISRGIGIYEALFSESAKIEKKAKEIRIEGRLSAGHYRLAGNISSQFITGLLFALPTLEGDSTIEILPPFESRGYVMLTLDILRRFGIEIEQTSDFSFSVAGGQRYLPIEAEVEGDYSQAAFFYGLNFLGGEVELTGLDPQSCQGDRICVDIFEKMSRGYVCEDLADCPDLAPILFAMASAGQGARFTGTRRLAIKESNRALVMAKELEKFGAKITVLENEVKIAPCELHTPTEPLCGNNDHRIVMALSVLATRFGGEIEGAEAIAKSYPSFFEDLRRLGLEIREYET